MSLEIIFAWVWQICFVAFVGYVGYQLLVERITPSPRGAFYIDTRVLSKEVDFSRQQRQDLRFSTGFRYR